MIKKAISASLIGAMFVFNGCGDQEAVDRLAAQQELDKGNYNSTVATLEAKANRTDEENMVLASAYMGQAGFSFSDTMSVIANATSGDNANNDTFSEFVKEVETKMSPDTLSSLQKAISAYSAVGVANNAPAYQAISRASSTKTSTGDRDLFLGLAYLTKSTVVMSYLGDVSKLQSSQEIDNNLLASACAIVRVYAHKGMNGCTNPPTHESIDINGTTYTKLTVILDGNGGTPYYRLANANTDQVILTDYKAASLEPIKIDGEDVTIQDVLVQTINDSFDTIEAVAPDDVKDDIVKFKNEIGTVNGKVTEETVSNYIASQN